MYCPECGGEYREGFTHCADCDVDLVASLPPEEAVSDSGLVTVLETEDPAELAIAESMLQEAGIPFVKRGDYLKNPFAFGPFGLGFNDVAGAAEILVTEELAEAAERVLEELTAGAEEPAGEDGEEQAADLE